MFKNENMEVLLCPFLFFLYKKEETIEIIYVKVFLGLSTFCQNRLGSLPIPLFPI